MELTNPNSGLIFNQHFFRSTVAPKKWVDLSKLLVLQQAYLSSWWSFQENAELILIDKSCEIKTLITASHGEATRNFTSSRKTQTSPPNNGKNPWDWPSECHMYPEKLSQLRSLNLASWAAPGLKGGVKNLPGPWRTFALKPKELALWD